MLNFIYRISNGTGMKLDKSPLVRQHFDLNMRKVYVALCRRLQNIQRQNLDVHPKFCVVNPGIMLNKKLATSDISALSPEEICQLVESSPELPERLRYPLRTLPIAASIIAKSNSTQISYGTLKKAFDEAQEIHLKLLNKGLPSRKGDRTILNPAEIRYLVKQANLWRIARFNGDIYLVSEFGYKIASLVGGKLAEIDKAYLWRKN